ncbi:hypothetical protein [Mesorhizobium sp. M0859]|uniref:hypothetical protein n=1 Tax=Mesorhizobium sp. M0859 TaxID=2957014 RepID=UPI0033376C15
MIDIDKDWLSSQYSLRFDAIELVADGVNRTYRARAGQKYFYLRLYRAPGRPLSHIIAEVTLLTQFPDRADVGVSRPVATADRSAHILELACGGGLRHACLLKVSKGTRSSLHLLVWRSLARPSRTCTWLCQPPLAETSEALSR